jgi:hypothetical protein
MRKILTVSCFSILVFCISISIFSQFAISSPFPGDEAIIEGNMTADSTTDSQPPVSNNESKITNGSSVSINNTANQTIGIAVNNLDVIA